MTNDTEKKSGCGSSCQCGGEDTCGGSGRRTWILLALAVVGVLIAANVLRKDASGDSSVAPSGVPAVVVTNPLPRLVDLGAGKCIPCKMMAPILVELRETFSNQMEVVFVDVWEKPEAGEAYGIRVIPTQIFYDAAGRELFRHEGFFAREDILAKWKELGVELEVPSK